MADIAKMIGEVLRSPEDEQVRSSVLSRVNSLCANFVPYPGLYD